MVARHRAALTGLMIGLVVVAASMAIPALFGWDVVTRRDDQVEFPPLHGFWHPTFAPMSVVAVLLAAAAWWWAPRLAERLSWRRLLLASYVAGLAWLLALAWVDGPDGISRALGNPFEYLETARATDDIALMLSTFTDRISYGTDDNWVTHVAGHPPGVLLFFVGLVRIGLGGDLSAGLVVTAIAATTSLAVMSTLRTLGAEATARKAAPFLVFTPSAVFMAVSADAMFAAVAAWGLAALAYATGASGWRFGLWSVVGGLLLGLCMFLSYGLPLLGLLAVSVLLLGRSWRPLLPALLAALIVTAAFALAGFAWWEAYPVLVERYREGVAADRPQAYWVWGNFGALLISGGPLLGAGLAHAASRWRRTDRAGVLLAGVALVVIAAADLSGMSKSEVERIWLPFIPYLTLTLAVLPSVWRRWGLALQLATALLVQHLLYTSW
ncbi:hypothetical protein [Nocardioides sp. InS609-2]|uniref:hypothetical protein n=1 Tax=Nocardioides sp. InS609-2 TaxID=2760705 RepID=UPI0020BF3057|nr:hypothetical protein [Nocardioides sp. InS609-2]